MQEIDRNQSGLKFYMSSIRKMLLVAVAMALPLMSSMASAQESDPKAVSIAAQSMDAMGGKTNWNNTRYLRFTFFGSRTHHWDKWTGRYRLEGKSRDGSETYVILMNLNTKKGEAYVNGTRLEGEDLQKRLQRAEGAWINDTYWLLMPYKLTDPGVTLTYDGEETIDGVVHDKLHLSFDNVGRTPGDEYWAYINRDTHLMGQWMFLLQPRGEKKERSRGVFKWTNWKKYGNVMISSDRVGADGKARTLDNIAVFDTLNDSVFTSPDPVQ